MIELCIAILRTLLGPKVVGMLLTGSCYAVPVSIIIWAIYSVATDDSTDG